MIIIKELIFGMEHGSLSPIGKISIGRVKIFVLTINLFYFLSL